MSFRVGKSEPVGSALVRICREELQSTCELLPASATDPAAMHEVRKQLKRLRAALDLARPALGPTAAAESRLVRDVARLLAQYRETDALLELLEREARIAGSADYDFLEIAVRLHQIAHRAPGNRAADIETARLRLADFAARLETMPPFETAPPGLFLRRFRKNYKLARSLLHFAASRATEDAIHDLRKINKRLLNQGRLLRARGNRHLDAFRDQLVALDDLLGRSRDCANLAAILRGVPAAEAPLLHGITLRTHLEHAARDSRDRALALAARVYRRPSRAFAARALGRIG
jgi:CHAD domain-containing protein